MADDYILRKDALAFQDEIEPAFCFDNKTRNIFSATKDADLVAYLNAIPTADVRPVVRGIWQETEEPMGWTDVSCACCSVCGESFVLGDYEFSDFTEIFNFCPYCGADMRPREDGNDQTDAD